MEEAEKLRIEQSHSITIRSRRRIVVSDACIKEIWKAIEHEGGYSEVVVARKSGNVTTIRRLEELWKESNTGLDQIVVLVIKLVASSKTRRVEWIMDPESRSGTEISIFDRRDLAEQTASALQSILNRYEVESQLSSQLRPYIRIAIVIGVGLFTLQVIKNALESIVGGIGFHSLIPGILGAGAMLGTTYLITKIDKRIEVEIGRGKSRAEWNNRFRSSAVVVILSVVLTLVATHLF